MQLLLAPLMLGLLACVHAASPLPKGAIPGTGHTVGFGELKEEWRGEIIHLSWSPRSFLVKNFLSEEECEYLIKKAEPRMEKSAVVDNDTGKSVDSNIRTSTGMFFSRNEDEVIKRIEKRVAQVTMIPVEHQEGLQILHYGKGQKYEPHFDYFHDSVNSNAEHGGQRVVTLLMYLTTPEEGGETVFPKSETKVTGAEWSDCARKGLAVKTVRGDALLFYSLRPDGSTDDTSLHGSCPVIRGEKWSATKWIHVGPFTPGGSVHAKAALAADASGCSDKHEQCAEWAFFGECKKNPGFMEVECRKACKVCK